MTVCIATIYNNNAILGASDRMLTSGNVQFEPDSSKILNPTSSIAILTAGDSDIQTQIYESVSAEIYRRIELEPDKWFSVEETARMYRDKYVELRREAAEVSILAPLGLSWDSYISRQREMSDKIVEDLTYRLLNFQIASAHTIISGIDDTGVHLFVVRNDLLTNSDKVGFAAVGSGATHALSHLMLSGYSRNISEEKALVAIHQAKKKAEVSPGVGEATDLFVLGPKPGSFNILGGPNAAIPIVQDLDNFYKTYKRAIARLDLKTEDKIKNYILNTVAQNQPEQQADAPASEPAEGVKEVKALKPKSRKTSPKKAA